MKDEKDPGTIDFVPLNTDKLVKQKNSDYPVFIGVDLGLNDESRTYLIENGKITGKEK